MDQEDVTSRMVPISSSIQGTKKAWRRDTHWCARWAEIRVGDYVKVSSGKDKEKEGEVIQTDVRRNMVRVRGYKTAPDRISCPEWLQNALAEKQMMLISSTSQLLWRSSHLKHRSLPSVGKPPQRRQVVGYLHYSGETQKCSLQHQRPPH